MEKHKKKTLTISKNLKKKIDTTSISSSGKKSFSVEKKKPFRPNKQFNKPGTTPFTSTNQDIKRKNFARKFVEQQATKDFIKKENKPAGKSKLKLKELGVEEELANLKGMTQGMLVILGQKNIKKLNDFADLSSDELIGGYDEIKGKKMRIDGYLEEFSLSRKEADDLIMAAREIAYK